MKIVKRILMTILFMPLLFVACVITFEIFGIIVNHTATAIQTRKLVKLAEAANGTEVIDTYSETGNTGPTGNHVDMLTILIVRTEGDITSLEEQLKDYAGMDNFRIESIAEIKEIRKEFDYMDSFYNQLNIPEDDDGCYMIYYIDSAPFSDNIEGH